MTDAVLSSFLCHEECGFRYKKSENKPAANPQTINSILTKQTIKNDFGLVGCRIDVVLQIAAAPRSFLSARARATSAFNFH